jgi:hypothetical protein
MGRSDLISGPFWFLFSLVIVYMSYKLGLGDVRHPGPGFFFFLTGIVLAILAFIVTLSSFRKRSVKKREAPAAAKMNLLKIVLVLAALFLYSLLMEWLGFAIVTLLLFIFLLMVIEKKRWFFAVPVSLAVTLIAYLIFEVGLQSQLPRGILQYLRF